MAMAIGQSISMASSGLARQSSLNYTANGLSNDFATAFASQMGTVLDGADDAVSAGEGASFEDAMLKALDGVNASQSRSSDLMQQMVVDPDSVDAQDVTIAMAEANLSLNLAKTILSRVVTAWKDVINTR
jgi:flagellar hook-basal body complex protein FliE